MSDVINLADWKEKMKPDVLMLNKITEFVEKAMDIGVLKYCQPSDLMFDDNEDINKVVGTLKRIYVEEHNEFIEAVDDCHSPEEVTKELADALFTILQFAIVFQLPIVEALNRVCANNMLKWEVGKIENGKLVKPKDFPKVDLSDLFAE